MKCISCLVEINPQWKHAIDINVCPFCGKHIMEEHLKNLLSSLCETMEKLNGYQDQLNDWMLSNHNYIKTDSPEIGKYMPKDMVKDLKKVEDDKEFQKKKDAQKFKVKVQTEAGEEEVEAEKIQSEETTNEFFKRAEVIKSGPANTANPATFQTPAERTQYLKKIAQQIKKAGSPSVNESGSDGIITPEMMDQADPEAVAEFQSLISGGEIASALPDAGDEDVPAFVLNANIAAANKKGGSNSSATDLLKLQQLQNRVNQSKENFESGANRGKGGFSRST